MNKFRDTENIKMTQIKLQKTENVLPQMKNILGGIKNRLDTADTSIIWRHRGKKNYPEWNLGLKRLAKSWLTAKDPDAGKDGRQKEKGAADGEMVRKHHRLNGHEF